MMIDSTKDKIVAIIEARVGSSRLPGKVLMPLAGKPLLQHIIERIKLSKYITSVVLATTAGSTDDRLEDFARSARIECFRGSENDVLGRVACAVRSFKPDVVVNLTGDNPLVDPALIDDMVDFFYEGGYDYVTNTYMNNTDLWAAVKTFPFGLGVQILKASVLLEVDNEISDIETREHATFGIYHRSDGRYKLGAFSAEGKYSGWKYPDMRLTVDTDKDYELMNRIFEKLYYDNPVFSALEAIKMVACDPCLAAINDGVKQRKVEYKRN